MQLTRELQEQKYAGTSSIITVHCNMIPKIRLDNMVITTTWKTLTAVPDHIYEQPQHVIVWLVSYVP